MLNNLRKYLLYFLILVYVSGAIGLLIQPSFFIPFTPYTLSLTCIVFLIYQPLSKLNFVLGFLCIAIIGFASEVIGVKTGFVFGDYHYGSTLGYKLLGVPLVISLNWALLVTCGIILTKSLTSNKALNALCSAGLITVIDLLIEQLAPSLDFWHFKTGFAGIHNYLGWFIISFITSFLLQNYVGSGNKKTAYIILVLQVFFFGFMYLIKLFNFV
ncbi:carotenoid biosynthesis protein [Aurantibacillus circumpalustris]|uniref:carotenoid biosynthesis protein n=1 Tax=Aurantibacillus circumpalustris TaxID=3036359 RepID=UPI00295C19F5|nr:carotenoid biosynthesis protein [Aurantibacillus circumpalustris]